MIEKVLKLMCQSLVAEIRADQSAPEYTDAQANDFTTAAGSEYRIKIFLECNDPTLRFFGKLLQKAYSV